MTAGISTANVAAALIPPQPATATADLAAARTRPPPRAARTSGSRIHGAIAAGRNSDDRPPIRVSAAGEAASPSPAAIRDPGQRAGGADAQPAGEQHDAGEGGDADRADPQPLDHPRRQAREMAEGK